MGPRSRGSQLYLLHLLAVLVGLVLVVAGQWRAGVVVIGGAFVVGALARSVVPLDHTGMLRVRGKAFDVFWMSTLGVALVVLALVIPGQPA
jgi:hypothetical protein